jgi:hypothetical protein
MNEATELEALRLLMKVNEALGQSRLEVYSSIRAEIIDGKGDALQIGPVNNRHACAVIVLDAMVVRDLRRFLRR